MSLRLGKQLITGRTFVLICLLHNLSICALLWDRFTAKCNLHVLDNQRKKNLFRILLEYKLKKQTLLIAVTLISFNETDF